MRSRRSGKPTSVDHGHVQRRVVELVLGVDSGAESDQQLSNPEVAFADGDIERSVAVFVVSVEDCGVNEQFEIRLTLK